MLEPCFRQKLFGPKIKGVPLVAWVEFYGDWNELLEPPPLRNPNFDPDWDKKPKKKVKEVSWYRGLVATTYPEPTSALWNNMALEDRRQILLALADDPRPAVRRAVARDLGTFSAAEMRAKLEKGIKEKPANPFDLWSVPSTPEVERALLRYLDHEDTRLEAVQSLGRLRPPCLQVVPKLVEYMRDNPDVRYAAAGALGAMGSQAPEIRKQVVPLLREDNESVRKVAALALQWMGQAAEDEDGTSAKKRFEELDKRLVAAKTQQIAFDIDARDKHGPISLKGVLILGQGNRMKLVFDGLQMGSKSKVTWLSDGKTMTIQTEIGGKTTKASPPVPILLSYFLASNLGRTSMLSGMNSIGDRNPTMPSKLKPFAFQAVGKEKIGDKEALLIEYKLELPVSGNLMKCKLFLDAKTGLPLKRLVEVSRNGIEVLRNQETYGEWQLNPALSPDVFRNEKE